MVTTGRDRQLLALALEAATKSLSEGQAPVGAVLADRAGNLLGSSRAATIPAGDEEKHTISMEHAELRLLLDVANGKESGDWYGSPYTLYVSLEPCHMCMGAAIVARIRRVVWALDDYWGGSTKLYDVGREYLRVRMPELVRTPFPDLQKQSADLWVKHLSDYNLPHFISRMLRWQANMEV